MTNWNLSKLFALASVALLLAACATTPKIDWASRVGNYSFDNAVREMGPPDKDAKLSDGSRVSEWLTDRGQARSVIVGYPRSRYSGYHDIVQSPDYYLRLSFDTNGTLIDWKKYSK